VKVYLRRPAEDSFAPYVRAVAVFVRREDGSGLGGLGGYAGRTALGGNLGVGVAYFLDPAIAVGIEGGVSALGTVGEQGHRTIDVFWRLGIILRPGARGDDAPSGSGA